MFGMMVTSVTIGATNKTKYPNAIQIGDSGIFNVPYTINTQNIDRYPLTQPFNSEFYTPKIPPKISIISPVNEAFNEAFNESSVPLLFTVDKQVSWLGYSLDGHDNVTVSGNTTISELTRGLHNVTVYAKSTFGNEGASETVAFTVAFESFPTVHVLVVSVATATVVCVALLVYFKKRRATNFKRNNEI
jgi:hypothetical protein